MGIKERERAIEHTLAVHGIEKIESRDLQARSLKTYKKVFIFCLKIPTYNWKNH